MKKNVTYIKIFVVAALCASITGCATIPTGFLKPEKAVLENRALEMRQYDTKDEDKIVKSVAGLLQDLGFIMDSSETKLGFVAASKKADAKNAGQIAAATAVDALAIAASAFGAYCYSNSLSKCDKNQLIKASVIIQPSADGSKMVVRATFQRMVWNMCDQVSRIETIIEPKMYQTFFEGLSKAIFLEAQNI